MRLVRLNEVKYTDNEHVVADLLAKGFAVEEVGETTANIDFEPDTESETESVETHPRLDKMKKPELQAYAEAHGIAFDKEATVKELITLIQAKADVSDE